MNSIQQAYLENITLPLDEQEKLCIYTWRMLEIQPALWYRREEKEKERLRHVMRGYVNRVDCSN